MEARGRMFNVGEVDGSVSSLSPHRQQIRRGAGGECVVRRVVVEERLSDLLGCARLYLDFLSPKRIVSISLFCSLCLLRRIMYYFVYHWCLDESPYTGVG